MLVLVATRSRRCKNLHGCSFEEARVRKEHKLCVTQKRVQTELEQRGVLVPPNTKVAQNALLLELMLKEINNEEKV